MKESPAASSWWHRAVRRALAVAGPRRPSSPAATGTVLAYVRVIPVLVGQVREAASHIEHTAFEIRAGFGALAADARRAVSRARHAAGGPAVAAASADDLVAESRQAVQQLHHHGIASAQRAMDGAACIEDTIAALKVVALHLDRHGPVADELRHLLADLERSLTSAMRILRQGAEGDVAGLARDTNAAGRAIDCLGARDAAMRRDLGAAARETEHLADGVSRAAAALQFQDCVGERLQHVIDTLSEMQDASVAALERPDGRPESAGSAALRLRQRYTALAARR